MKVKKLFTRIKASEFYTVKLKYKLKQLKIHV